MGDYRLKVVLTIFSSIIFALIFIILAFVLPLDKPKQKNPTATTKELKESFGEIFN
ncbi:MAG: hypothetical protein WCR69_02985 [Sulfuricurvum sp.]|jgi:hypothetical protein